MLCEEGARFFRRVAFAASCLGEAFVEIGVDRLLVAQKPDLLGRLCLDEIEGVGEELSGLAEAPGGELLLKTLLRGGVEGDDHGVSITPWRGGGRQFSRFGLRLRSGLRYPAEPMSLDDGWIICQRRFCHLNDIKQAHSDVLQERFHLCRLEVLLVCRYACRFCMHEQTRK